MVPRHGVGGKDEENRSLSLEALMPLSDSSRKAFIGNRAVWNRETVAPILVTGTVFYIYERLIVLRNWLM